jgi:hypothetical protein
MYCPNCGVETTAGVNYYKHLKKLFAKVMGFDSRSNKEKLDRKAFSLDCVRNDFLRPRAQCSP